MPSSGSDVESSVGAGVPATPRLEIRGLSKTFAGVTVLDQAYLTLQPGEIHALVGQNGSGKSTLIKLMSGVYRADPGGDILIDGKRIGPQVDPRRLHDEGISFVHQDLGLVGDLSVRENVRVGRHATRRFGRWIDTAKDREAVRQTFDFLGIDIDVDAKTEALTPSERVAVAVARALQGRNEGSGIIVFDESSRGIPHEALGAFHDMIRLLASQGSAVLLVSHNLREVLDVADRATALRNGRVVEMGVPTAELDEAALTKLVLGRDGELDDYVASMPRRAHSGAISIDSVRGGRIDDFSVEVARGEIVGVTGNINSGLSDLASLLGGDMRASGTLDVCGTSVQLARAGNVDLLRAGVALIPQDRAAKGLAVELTVEENITLPHLRSRSRPWWLGNAWRIRDATAVLNDLDVRPRDRNAVVSTMSGGNQQKVLMGKWLLGQPLLLVLDDPTQAVDVGARSAVLQATREAAQGGVAVVLCSSEVEDLRAVCDRVLILRDGKVAHELVAPFGRDEILDATFTSTEGAA